MRARPSTIIGTVVAIGVVAGITVLGLHLHADAARSSTTQHHGAARDGVVASVTPVHHDTAHDSWTTYDYRLSLSASVGDVDTTVAHDPTKDFQRYSTGDQVGVLVDPDDTGYAELPGRPVGSSTWYVAPLVLGLVFLGLVALIVARTRALRRRRVNRDPS